MLHSLIAIDMTGAALVDMGVWIRWTGTMEWNGGMDWTGTVEWNGMEWIGVLYACTVCTPPPLHSLPCGAPAVSSCCFNRLASVNSSTVSSLGCQEQSTAQ